MKLVFATHNLNKLKEVKLLQSLNIELLGLKDIGCDEDIPETATTIDGNAILKAKYVSDKFNCNCFADDTGLEVDILNGDPGVYSARYAGEQCSANDNMEKLLMQLKGKTERDARFKTVIALILDGELHTFTGVCKGEIIHSKKGAHGFGYDPIFKPFGHDLSFAEMDLKLKNKISHRAKAIKQLIEFLSTYNSGNK